MVDGDTPTPTIVDPCVWCGGKLVRVTDRLPAPSDLSEAWRDWRQNCVAAQSNMWAYCPRANKGQVMHESMKMLSLERRAGLR